MNDFVYTEYACTHVYRNVSGWFQSDFVFMIRTCINNQIFAIVCSSWSHFFSLLLQMFFSFTLKDSCPKILYFVYNLLKNPYVHFIHPKNYCLSTSIQVSMILFHVIIYALFCCVYLCEIESIKLSFHSIHTDVYVYV